MQLPKDLKVSYDTAGEDWHNQEKKMTIKTPVQFGPFGTLEDADGQTFLDLDQGSSVFPETRQAIIDAFEDAARWRFLLSASDDPTGSPEGQAMSRLGKSMAAEYDDAFPAKFLVKLVDAARAELAK